MGLFKRKQGLVGVGLPGTAVIFAEERAEFWDAEESTSLTDFGLGNFKFKFDLEVTLDDGRAPYRVTDKFKVPAKLGGETGRGVALPVFADPDDPMRIQIDWDRFIADGGAEAFRAGSQSKREARTRAVVEAGAADAQAANAAQIDAMVEQGTMTAAEGENQKRLTKMSAAGELDDMPPDDASPREMLEWQRAKGIIDQATYDAIIANNPNLK